MESVLGVHPSNMDTSVSPKADFYRYANGKWLERNPIPDEYSRWGAFEQLHELSQAQLKAILEDCELRVVKNDDKEIASAEDPLTVNRTNLLHMRLVGILYASGMDEEKCDHHGFTPMHALYNEIDAAKTTTDIALLAAKLNAKTGLGAGFLHIHTSPDAKNSNWSVLHLSQYGILGIGDRDFYLEPSKSEIRDKYVSHVEKLLTLSGIPKNVAARNAKAMMELETRMAEKCMTKTEHRDPHKTYNKFETPTALGQMTKTEHVIPWKRFFAEMGLDEDFGGVVVDNPGLVEALGQLLEQVDVETWKTYLRFHITSTMAPYLGKDAVAEHFDFRDKVLTGQPEMKPRWKRVISHVGALLTESLGILYVAKHFSPEAKKSCREMVDILVDVMRSRIDAVPWMSADTKQRAHAKLARFYAKIGYPDKWDLDHISQLEGLLKTEQSYATNVLAVRNVEASRLMKRVNKAVDKDRWEMPPFIINAYFHPTRNEIVFPSAILQPPFYVPPSKDLPHGDVPINFAAIGAVICHEISHGYDDQGRKFDENGELNDWWTEADSAEYMRRAELLVDQYSEYSVFGEKVNGKLCLGENVADLGGVKLAYIGLQRYMREHGMLPTVDGFTPEQRFFLGWATIWRNNIRQENALRRIVMDPHSPGEFRANGPLQVLREFHEAFGVKEGDAMFRPVDQRCEIW